MAAAMSLEPREFRRALGSFATGVTIVTSRDPAGEPLGLTANSFNSVSLDPPLVLFSLHRNAYSLKSFEESGFFAINILSDRQRHLSEAFARSLTDKWRDVAYEVWDTGAPILSDALASFECLTHSTHDGGDHVIFVGRVQRLRASGEGHPLLYFRGGYCGLGGGG
jgi:flavin reductase (DIM6/NTAB) family NADH-FMN oxidoreductase RutF